MTTNSKATIPSISPLHKLAAGLALTLCTVFSASAHVPPEGSPQNLLLKDYEEFITHMKNKAGSSCCNKLDGRGDLAETIKQDGTYEVTITHDLAGNKLSTPRKAIIPEHAILTVKHAKQVCDAVNASKSPEERAKSTCKQPPFNVIWYNDSGHVYCYFPRPQLMN